MDYPSLYYKEQRIPLLEIEQMLKAGNFIFIMTKDKTYNFEFDNEKERDEAYEELSYYFAEYFGLRD